jgi:hypothetical protein
MTTLHDFHGATYLPLFDQKRLSSQYERVFQLMSNGDWWTLNALAERAKCSEASVSARIRDMRKPKFGGHTVNRKRFGDWAKGLHAYKLIVRAK